jgi:hypothetical protein
MRNSSGEAVKKVFDGKWGSVGDFYWNLKASLVANTVHVPDTWGGWRLHPGQATGNVEFGTLEHRYKIEEMIDDLIRSISTVLPSDLYDHLNKSFKMTLS